MVAAPPCPPCPPVPPNPWTLLTFADLGTATAAGTGTVSDPGPGWTLQLDHPGSGNSAWVWNVSSLLPAGAGTWNDLGRTTAVLLRLRSEVLSGAGREKGFGLSFGSTWSGTNKVSAVLGWTGAAGHVGKPSGRAAYLSGSSFPADALNPNLAPYYDDAVDAAATFDAELRIVRTILPGTTQAGYMYTARGYGYSSAARGGGASGGSPSVIQTGPSGTPGLFASAQPASSATAGVVRWSLYYQAISFLSSDIVFPPT
jgi:hypothetical protein